jgi:hypothetical protein
MTISCLFSGSNPPPLVLGFILAVIAVGVSASTNSFLTIVSRVSSQRQRRSRARLFSEKAGDIRSQLIAMTVVQQENRVHRSAKKADAHQGKDDLIQRGVGGAPIERV